jgi:glycosyltransferase involved in cell wall biosynthesis
MNILFLTFLYPNKFNPIFGGFIKEHAIAMKKAGLSIKVLAICVVKQPCILNFSEEHFTDENNIPTHIFYIHSRFHKFFLVNLFFLYWIARRFIEKNVFTSIKPDVIHSNILYPSGIIGHFLSRKYNANHIITEHWSKIELFFQRNIFRKFGKHAYQKAKYITVVSSFLKHQLIRLNIEENKIIIIPNVVTPEFEYKKKKPNEESIIFCSVAAWITPKRPDLIISALKKISMKINKKIIYHIVGIGPLIEEIRTQATNLPFKIIFNGVLEKTKIAEILDETDYFLHASDKETFSVVIAEALMTGTPVVASNVGAIPELVDEGNGILCENTPENWEEAIFTAIQKNFNHEKIVESIQNKYSQKTISENFKTIYEGF